MTEFKIDADHPMAKLAAKVYNTTALTNEQLSNVMTMELTMQPQEFTVSVSETRQVAQYESNNYFMSVKISLAAASAMIVDRVNSELDPKKRLEIYNEARKALSGLVASRYEKTENWMRELIHQQQIADGIAPK